mmetsp:Transcript_7503/g.17213  ORF Transcript_7503/g.17213 Transcript_7503/m.17213 type:complete len:292 (-) Transcript_7503:590-1465(-)
MCSRTRRCRRWWHLSRNVQNRELVLASSIGNGWIEPRRHRAQKPVQHAKGPWQPCEAWPALSPIRAPAGDPVGAPREPRRAWEIALAGAVLAGEYLTALAGEYLTAPAGEYLLKGGRGAERDASPAATGHAEDQGLAAGIPSTVADAERAIVMAAGVAGAAAAGVAAAAAALAAARVRAGACFPEALRVSGAVGLVHDQVARSSAAAAAAAGPVAAIVIAVAAVASNRGLVAAVPAGIASAIGRGRGRWLGAGSVSHRAAWPVSPCAAWPVSHCAAWPGSQHCGPAERSGR